MVRRHVPSIYSPFQHYLSNTVFYSLISACGTSIAKRVSIPDTLPSSVPSRDSHYLQQMEKRVQRIHNEILPVRRHRLDRPVYSETARFTQSVPNDTSIPSWAFLNLTTDDLWDYFASAESEVLPFVPSVSRLTP